MEAELLNGDFGHTDKIARLAAIRKQIWDAHREVDEARRQAKTSQLELEGLFRHKLELETRLAFFKEEASKLSRVDGEYEFLELVPLEEFLASNPDIDPEQIDGIELMSARVDDEEKRRLELFGQRIALKEKETELQSIIESQTEALRFKGQFCHYVKQLEETSQRLAEHIIQ